MSCEDACQGRRGLIWVIILFLVATGLLIAFLHCHTSSSSDDVIEAPETMGEVKKFYSDFFKSKQEAKMYVEQVKKHSNYSKENENATFKYVCRNGFPSSMRNTSSTTTPQPNLAVTPGRTGPSNKTRTKRSNSWTIGFNEADKLHACCRSRRLLVSPESAITEDGQSVQLLQFNQADSRQYFISEQYKQEPGCNLNCGCHDAYNTFSALVHNPNKDGSPKYVLRKIVVRGPAKCLNNVPPPSHNNWIV